MFGLSGEHLLILAGVLIIFGPRKLPELGASIGKALRNFKEGLNTPPAQQGPVESRPLYQQVQQVQLPQNGGGYVPPQGASASPQYAAPVSGVAPTTSGIQQPQTPGSQAGVSPQA